jgi:hypothetical protein
MARGTPGRKLVYLGGALTEIEGDLPKKIVVGGQISTWTLDRLRTAGVFISEAGAYKLSGRSDITIKVNGSKDAMLYLKKPVNIQFQFGLFGAPQQPRTAIGASLTIKLGFKRGEQGEQGPPVIYLLSYTTSDGDRRGLGDRYWISIDENNLGQGRGRKETGAYQDLSNIFSEILDAISNDNLSKLEEFKRPTTAEKARGDIVVGQNRYGRPIAGPGLPSPSGPKGLQFGDSLKYLQPSDARPLAHCIARSFQLLNIDALAGAPAKTSICSKTFKDVPAAGASITTIKGMKAFEFLYFVLGKSVGLSSMTKEAYNVALKYMFTKFGSTGTAPTATDDTTMRFDTIKSGAVGRCGSTTTDMPLDRAQTAIAKQGVAALWGYQRAHAAKVEKLFMKLFDLGRQRDGSLAIKISEYLFKGGIPAVEVVANEARILLGEYYGKCEEIYRATASKL